MTKPIVGAVVGPCGSGKTTFAETWSRRHEHWTTFNVSMTLVQSVGAAVASITDFEQVASVHPAVQARPKYTQVPFEHWLAIDGPKKQHRRLLQELGLYATTVYGKEVLIKRLVRSYVEPALKTHTFEGVWITGVRRVEELFYLRGYAENRGSQFFCLGIIPQNIEKVAGQDHEVESELDNLLNECDGLVDWTGNPDEVAFRWLPEVEGQLYGRKQHIEQVGGAAVGRVAGA